MKNHDTVGVVGLLSPLLLNDKKGSYRFRQIQLSDQQQQQTRGHGRSPWRVSAEAPEGRQIKKREIQVRDERAGNTLMGMVHDQKAIAQKIEAHKQAEARSREGRNTQNWREEHTFSDAHTTYSTRDFLHVVVLSRLPSFFQM